MVRPSSLGDVVHALPLVADIHRHVPHAKVDWIAEEAFAPLVRLHAGIHEVFPVALRRWRRQLLRPATWREFRTLRGTLGASAYDAVLDLQEQMKGALLARLAPGVRHGFDRASIREPISTILHERHHAVSRTLHFEDRCRALAARALGYAVEGRPDYGLVVPPPPPDLVPASRYVVAVHATSRESKLWPPGHWRTLIEAFAREGVAVMLPWGDAAERIRSVELARGLANAVVPPHRPLPAVASMLRKAEAVIGVDTGLVHLSAALGTPTVALFTRTDPALAGVAIAGAHARDLGGSSEVPQPEVVLDAIAGLRRRDDG